MVRMALLRDTAEDRTRARILDMAMSVPEPARLKRFAGDGRGVLSVSTMNKSMYAGGGGIALLDQWDARREDPRDAKRLRCEESAMNRLRNDLGVIARVFIRTRTLCVSAPLRQRSGGIGQHLSRHASTAAPLDETSAALSAEWTRPMTLSAASWPCTTFAAQRSVPTFVRRQAETYVACLGGHDLLARR